MKQFERMITALVLLFSLSLPAACVAVPANDTELSWLSADGTRIVNEKGRTVILKGLFLHNNTWGNWVWPVSERLQEEGKDPMIKPTEQDSWVLTEKDFEIFSGLALNHVVYDLNYELFLPSNAKRDSNLDRLEDHVKKFNSMGIYVVINFAGSPGLNVNSSNEHHKTGDVRLKSMFEDRQFQDLHVDFIRTVVKRLKEFPGVGGYILTDEPACPSNRITPIHKD